MQKRSRNLLNYQCESREEYGPRGISEDLSPIHVLQWKLYSRQVNLSGDSRCFRNAIIHRLTGGGT